MNDFERILRILENSPADFGVSYYDGRPESIYILDMNGNNRLWLNFYRDGKFLEIFIED